MFDSELPLHWDTSTTGLEGVEEKELLTASTAGTGRETDPESSTFKYCFQSKGGPYDSNPTLWSPASTWSLKLLLLRTALHQVLPKVSQGQPGGFLCCNYFSFLAAIFISTVSSAPCCGLSGPSVFFHSAFCLSAFAATQLSSLKRDAPSDN